MVTPRLVPQSSPFLYATVNTPSQYYNEPATRGRRQSLGPYPPGQQFYHVATSEPSHSRRHRSSSKSHKHRRSHSTDRHGSSRHHRRHRTPSRSTSVRYSPDVQYATTPSSRHRRHSYSVTGRHHRSSSYEPRGILHRSHNEHYVTSRHRESIGERIKRFFRIGGRGPRFVDGHKRPIYAV